MNKYHIKDARSLTSVVPPEIDLIVTSPPYFDMKDYGSQEQIGYGQKYTEYLEDMRAVLNQCLEVTKPTGSMWMVVDTLKKDGQMILLPFDLTRVAEECGWKLQDIIIWKKDRTIPFAHRGEMRNIFEYILFFVKTPDFKHYPERLSSFDLKEWWIKYPERYSVAGKNRTDVWEFPIPVQGSWGKSYVRHFCPLPRQMLADIIHLCTDKGDLVLDPFAGTGAVLYEAMRMQRKYIGCDLNPEYKTRFEAYLEENPPKPHTIADPDDTYTRNVYATTNIKLRALKYPAALLKLLRKNHPEEFSHIRGVVASPETELNTENTSWKVRYDFIVDGAEATSLDEKIKALTSRPPLSKYGIRPTFQFKSRIANKPALEYSVLSPHNPPQPFKGEAQPFIGSDISLTNEERQLVDNFKATGELKLSEVTSA